MLPVDAASFFRDAFLQRRAMAILRGLSPSETLRLARAAWSAEMVLVEVPLQHEQSFDALVAVVADAKLRGHVAGAGTVTSIALVERAAELGAAFTVAPGFDPEVAARSLEFGMPHLPGVATGSEVQKALSLGYTWLKAFPASSLGSAWITSMHGPFPDAQFVATGGISAENARGFLTAGAAGVSFGAGFASLSADDLAGLA